MSRNNPGAGRLYGSHFYILALTFPSSRSVNLRDDYMTMSPSPTLTLVLASVYGELLPGRYLNLYLGVASEYEEATIATAPIQVMDGSQGGPIATMLAGYFSSRG